MYYHLAKNISFKEGSLLNDVTLFTVMIVIKQKWPEVETKLIQVSNLLEVENNNEEYKKFISNVKPLLPIKLPSLMPFIYLKETNNEQEIIEKLRNGDIIENINSEIQKRISIEVKNLIAQKEQGLSYIFNASRCLFDSIQKDNSSATNIELIIDLGRLLDNLKHEITNPLFAEFIQHCSKELDKLFSMIPNFNNDELVSFESQLIRLLTESQNTQINIFGASACSELFEFLINEKHYKYNKNKIASIFTHITNLSEIDEYIQNYVKVALDIKKNDYIPDDFLKFVIDSIDLPLSENTKNVINSYSPTNIPKFIKKNLAKKINGYAEKILKSPTNFSNAENFKNLELFMFLLSRDDFDTTTLVNFGTNIINIITFLLKNQSLNNEACARLIIENLVFIFDDSSFSKVLAQFIDNYPDSLIEVITDDKFYQIQEGFKQPLTKQLLLSTDKITISIYDSYSKEIPQNYKWMLKEEIEINNLNLLLESLIKNNIDINESEFIDYLINKINTVEKIDIMPQLLEKLNAYNLEVTSEQVQRLITPTVRKYNEDPNKNLSLIASLKNGLKDQIYNEQVLDAIFDNLCIKLKAKESILNYSNITSVTTESYLENNQTKIKNLISVLLDSGREPQEYELPISLIEQLSNIKNSDINTFKDNIEIIKDKLLVANLQERTLKLFPIADEKTDATEEVT